MFTREDCQSNSSRPTSSRQLPLSTPNPKFTRETSTTLGSKAPSANQRLSAAPRKELSTEDKDAQRFLEEGSIRTSVEIQQLLIYFEEALGNRKRPLPSDSKVLGNKAEGQAGSEKGGQRRRPLLQYFQRCVSLVIQRNRTWVLQLGVQRLVIDKMRSWDQCARQTQAPPKCGVRSREDILQCVQDKTSFWENIAAAHRHTNKVVLPSPASARDDWFSPHPCSPVWQPAADDGKRSFPTLSKYSPRSWPSDVRSAGGLKSRPGTKDSFAPGSRAYRNYADMLLAEQERESALRQLNFQRSSVAHRSSSHRSSRIRIADTLDLVPEAAEVKSPPGREATRPCSGFGSSEIRACLLPPLEIALEDGSCGLSPSSKRGSRCQSRGRSRGQSRGQSRSQSRTRSPGQNRGRDPSRGQNRGLSPKSHGNRSVELEAMGPGVNGLPFDSHNLLPPLLASDRGYPGSWRQPSLSARSAPPTYADHRCDWNSTATGGSLHKMLKTDSMWHGVGARGSPRDSSSSKRNLPLFERLPQLARLEGNPLTRPGQAQILSDVIEDRIIVEFDGDLTAERAEDNEARPEVQYFRTCDSLGILPEKLDFLTQQSMQELNLASIRMTDDQFRAIVGAIMRQPHDLRLLDISGNGLLTDATLQSSVRQLAETCVSLRTLRLGNTQLGIGGMEVLARAMSSLQLEELSLHGVPLTDQGWSLLSQSLVSVGAMVVLDLTDTQCGRWHQFPCTQLLKDMKDLLSLRSLDISSNYFRRQGLVALGRFLRSPRCRLQTLVLDDNACCESSEAADSAAGGCDWHPLVAFCEDLGFNRSLQVLSLCSSQVDVTAAHCLEDAAVSHPNLTELRVSGNPFGEAGVRALLRGLLRERSPLVRLDFSDFGKAASTPALTFNYGDLTESYIDERVINLQHPYHRAVLRLILWRTRDFGQSPEACMHSCKLDGHGCKLDFKLDSAGHWKLPIHGILQFDLALRLPLGSANSPDKFIMKWQRARRLPVEYHKFITLQRVFAKLLSEFERHTLLAAIAKECLLKNAQVKMLTEDAICRIPDLAPQVAANLALATAFVNRPCINSTLLPCHDFYTGEVSASRSVDARQMPDRKRQRALRFMKELLLMNVNNVSGHYDLNLQEPMEYAVAERIFLISSWEAEVARQRGTPDTSQRGGFCAIRNFLWNGEPQGAWALPGDGYKGEGSVQFDYNSLLLPLARELPIDEDTFSRLNSVLRREFTDASETAVMSAFIHISHLLVISAPQLAGFLQVVDPGPQRIKLYCKLVTRCCDIGPPVVSHTHGVLGDQPGWGLFSWSDRQLICERVGLVNTMDWLNIDLSLESEQEACECPRNRYTMNLEHNDGHLLATILLGLSGTEPGDNVVNASWSCMSNRTSGMWLVPSTWRQAAPPREGVFQATYVLENSSQKDLHARRKCGRRCGWLVTALGDRGAAVDEAAPAGARREIQAADVRVAEGTDPAGGPNANEASSSTG